MSESIYPISIAEMRERYLKLYSGAVNDVLRFEYKMHAALPSSYAPLKPEMKICGQAFTIKGGPDITTDGEFEARAKMLEDLHADSVDIATIICDIEDQFNIEIEDEQLEGITTVGDVAERIEQLI